MKFTNKKHEERFLNLMISDSTYHDDAERQALWYIISGNDDLYAKRHHLYDFASHGIKHCLDSGSVDLCSSSRALTRLGFNLYNRYHTEDMTPCDLFSNLDSGNMKLALNALRLRFDWSTALEFSDGYEPQEQENEQEQER